MNYDPHAVDEAFGDPRERQEPSREVATKPEVCPECGAHLNLTRPVLSCPECGAPLHDGAVNRPGRNR